MDSSTLTHVAAICIGVVVTLAMMGIFSSSSKQQVEQPVVASDGTNQKKKKKRNKKKAVTAKGGEQEIVEKESTVNGTSNSHTNPQAGGKKKAKKTKSNKVASNGTVNKEEQATPALVAPVAAPVKPKPQPVSTTSRNIDSFEQAPPVENEWNSVGAAKKKVRKVRAPITVSSGSTTTADSISVDARKVGIIIGPKGATMLALQEATGCKLDINAPARDGPTKANAKAGVVITGPNKESIQMAKKAVQELATKGYATLLQSDNFGEFGTQVHPRMLSEIVGPGGKTIQAIQTTLNVKITIPPTNWNPNARDQVVKPVMVGIAGTKENAKTAKTVIQALQKYHHHEVTHPGMIHKEVYVPHEFYHCVIGVRGSEIKHIRGNYKVDMYMPDDDSETDCVLVVGRVANVDKAIAYIQLLMDRDSDARQQKYSDEHY